MSDEMVALVGLVGALAGAWLGAHISRKASRELLQQQAQGEFAAAFISTITKLYLGHEQEPGYASDQLNEDFSLHFSARQKLRAVLGRKDRAKLDKRWDEYSGDKKYELPEERDMYRFSELMELETSHEQNMAAINRINRLLHGA